MGDYKKWSQREIDYLNANRRYKTVEEIANFLGRTVTSVMQRNTRDKRLGMLDGYPYYQKDGGEDV